MSSCSVKVYVVENARLPAVGKPGPAMREKLRRLDEAYDAIMGDLAAAKSTMIGVDCEGTDSSRFEGLRNKAGCQMVQVSSPTVVVVEVSEKAR
jgi:hypothetical protein